MIEKNRRNFLLESVAATTLLAAATKPKIASACFSQSVAGPNEQLSVAVIGVNSRGQSHVNSFVSHADTVVTHICDCDERVGQTVCDMVEEKQGRRPIWIRDMRSVFDEPSVDIVSIATPNHWHSLAAIWAVQAGKDVYVEKPVSHNVWEGRQLVNVAAREKRIVQTGTQSRSNPGMKNAMKFIHQGGIGRVKIARGLCYKPRASIGPRGTYQVPEYIDYDLWSGPAEMLELTRPRFHYDWHWQWPYGNGDLGNQGIHQMDLCRWALQQDRLADSVLSYGGRFGYEDAGDTANTQFAVFEYGDQQLVFEVRGLETDALRGAKIGILIEGEEGYLMMSSYQDGIAFDLEGNEIRRFRDGSDSYHYDNFVQAVKKRDPLLLNAPIEDGHLSSALCHLANISLRTGDVLDLGQMSDYVAQVRGPEDMQESLDRVSSHLEQNGIAISEIGWTAGPRLELSTDETFVNHEDANQLLKREYRSPYVVPEIA